MKFGDSRRNVEIEVSVKKKRYAICKVGQAPQTSDKIFATIIDDDEITVVAEENHGLKTLEEEKFFKIISVKTKLPFNLVGFTAHISKLLAEHNISILMISAYSTDHIIVKEEDLNKTLEALRTDGIKVS